MCRGANSHRAPDLPLRAGSGHHGAVAKSEEEPWYAVRCLFKDDAVFEERITVWRADDFDAAIGQA
jgi:hypothetical protein